MHILYHHRTLGDGAEGIHISEMIRAFRNLGHNVAVASFIGEKTNTQSRKHGRMAQIARVLPQMLYELAELWYSVPGFFILRRKIKEQHPAFIYERYALFNFAGILAGKIYKIPVFLEVNSPLAVERAQYEKLSLGRFAHYCEKFIWSRVKNIAVVSTPLKEYMIEQGISPSRIMVMPNGADPERMILDKNARTRLRSQLGINDRTIVAGFSGILRPWHGLEILVKAVAHLLHSGCDIKLLIVGDGPSRKAIEELAERLNIADNLIITGRVPHAEVRHYLSVLDIAVSPKTTFYASPMKIPEYMALGLAVVAPKMANIEDLIDDKISGVLFEPEDESDLQANISLLIEDEALRRSVGATAKDIICRKLNWEANANSAAGLYEVE